MKFILNSVLLLFLLNSCGSSEVIPTKDLCSLEKHYKDNIFQVQINGDAINKHWYIYPEAKIVAKKLAEQNKCKSMN